MREYAIGSVRNGGGLSGLEKKASPAKLTEWPEPKGICPVL